MIQAQSVKKINGDRLYIEKREGYPSGQLYLEKENKKSFIKSLKNKDFIHHANHPSGAYVYTIKNDVAGLYEVHHVNRYGQETIWFSSLKDLQQNSTCKPGYIVSEDCEQLLNEIAAQANGKTDVSSGDYFTPPSDESVKKECEKMSKDGDNIVQINSSYIDGIAFKDQKTGEIIEGAETVVPYYYNLFYFWDGTKGLQYIGSYYQGECKTKGFVQTDNYVLLNAVLEEIHEKVEQDKKEKRESKELSEQNAYETGLKDGKKSAQEEQKQPRFRITLEANNEASLGPKIINDGSRSKVVNETNEETAEDLVRMFVDAMKGVGFQEPTVHQSVIELADEFASLDEPRKTLSEMAQLFADELGSQEAYEWYIAVEDFKNN